MENVVEFRMPQAIFYGRGAFAKVGEEAALRGKKALIISDRIMKELGNVSECEHYLDEARVASISYLEVNTEPTDIYVAECVELVVQENCDVIIALGGGSCLDTAKAVSVLASNGGSLADYIGGRKPMTSDPIPVIAIPTTAGTGSEVTSVTIIIDSPNDVKMMIKHPALIPAVAIADPILSLSAPPKVTAATGMDALCHAIEAYISRKAQPLSDVLALKAIKTIMENIETVYEDGTNLEAREHMMNAALQAGAAFTNSSVCLVHGMSRPIGAVFHVPHGMSNAMLLSAVLEFSKDHALKRLGDIGRLVAPELSEQSDEELANEVVRKVKELCKVLHIPNMKEWGIDKETFDSVLPKLASDALASGSPGNNPRIPTHKELLELYRRCYDYKY